MPSASVTAVCVVYQILPDPGQDPDVTAIDKRAVRGKVAAGRGGLVGDTQCDHRNHGGPDQAIYVYADEDAAWWADHLGRDIPPGLFGENLRVSGIDVTGAEIGERWRIGSGDDPLLVEVTKPRIPCTTFQTRLDEPHWVKRFTDHGAPGAYLRVIQPGEVEAGDRVAIEHRPGHGVTIAHAFLPRANATMMGRLLDAADAGRVDLAAELREVAVRASTLA